MWHACISQLAPPTVDVCGVRIRRTYTYVRIMAHGHMADMAQHSARALPYRSYDLFNYRALWPAIDPAGSQYIDYANTFTHAHLRLARIFSEAL